MPADVQLEFLQIRGCDSVTEMEPRSIMKYSIFTILSIIVCKLSYINTSQQERICHISVLEKIGAFSITEYFHQLASRFI
jgi:hypothetical protein